MPCYKRCQRLRGGGKSILISYHAKVEPRISCATVVRGRERHQAQRARVAEPANVVCFKVGSQLVSIKVANDHRLRIIVKDTVKIEFKVHKQGSFRGPINHCNQKGGHSFEAYLCNEKFGVARVARRRRCKNANAQRFTDVQGNPTTDLSLPVLTNKHITREFYH